MKQTSMSLIVLCGFSLLGCASAPEPVAEYDVLEDDVTFVEGTRNAVTEAMVYVVGEVLLGNSCEPEPERDIYCNEIDEYRRDRVRRLERDYQNRREADARREALADEFDSYMDRESVEPATPETSIMFDEPVMITP
ncbi:MAG: hypothetical protein AAFN07_16420 [Pseudomonadota bacterium]